MKEIGEIQSKNPRVQVKSDEFGLTSIENHRYLIIKKGFFKKLNYRFSFACPGIIGINKENAGVLKKYPEKMMGKMELIYTHSIEGRKHLLKCRRWSYINRNENFIYNKKNVSKWE